MNPRSLSHLTLRCALAAGLILLSMPLYAQDEDDGMEFGVDEVDPVDQAAEETPQALDKELTALVAVKISGMSGEERAELQEAMEQGIKAVKKVSVTGPAKVLAGLEERDVDSCIKETLCLSSVGRDAGVGRVLLAHVSKTDSGYRLDLELFDVTDKLFLKYKTVNDLGSFSAAISAVEPALKDLYDVREFGGPKVVDNEDTGIVQTVFAYTTAGLALACIGGGIVYGMDASAQEKEVTDKPGSFTQRQAQIKLNDASNTGTTANIFYALGVAFGLTSVLLFTIDFGSDVDESETEEVFFQPKNLQLTPSVSAQGVGFGASFSF
jgi:hypothetical protein